MLSLFPLLFLCVDLLTRGQLIGSPSDSSPCVGPSEQLPVVQPDLLEMLFGANNSSSVLKPSAVKTRLSRVPLLITQDPDLEK